MTSRTVFLSIPDLLFFAVWCVGTLLGALALLAAWHWLFERHRRRLPNR
ncbi:hypothetical protein [Pseudolabrys taiwanensis]|nr:hypothetical protein [Pseudolabrys taiwanensis]